MAKITDIKSQKNKDRVNLYLDGKFYSGLMKETLFSNNLKVGDYIDENKLKDILFASETKVAFEKALSLLERKLYFEKELRLKLKEKGFIDEIIDRVVGKLKDYNYINDDGLVKSYISSQKVKSKKEIEFKLKQKGVSDYYIRKHTDEISEEDEENKCLLVCEKYARNKEITKENIQKILKYLVGKGFSFDVAKRVVNKKFKNFEVDYD